MLFIGSIVLRVDDLGRQAAFWAAALDYVPRAERSEDFLLLRPRTGIGPNLSLDLHHSNGGVPPRFHLDLYTDDQVGEVKRLLALGATEVHWDKQPPDADYVILADPEGNRFCVVDTQHEIRSGTTPAERQYPRDRAEADLADAANLGTHCVGPDQEWSEYNDYVSGRARDVVRDNWQVITELAAELAACREMSGADAEHFVRSRLQPDAT